MLGMEYGKTTVGALRMLKSENLQSALRQELKTENGRSILENIIEISSMTNKSY